MCSRRSDTTVRDASRWMSLHRWRRGHDLSPEKTHRDDENDHEREGDAAHAFFAKLINPASERDHSEENNGGEKLEDRGRQGWRSVPVRVAGSGPMIDDAVEPKGQC